MGGEAAFRLAIELFHFPAQARSLRDAPLPDGIANLIQVAAGDEKAVREACDLLGRSSGLVREAAAFYVEQILLHPAADSYRVLGAKPDATYEELRRNMAHLLRWMHPDSDHKSQRMVFAARVTDAWDNLKTKERRARYDLSQAHLEAASAHLNRRRNVEPRGHAASRYARQSTWRNGARGRRREQHIEPFLTPYEEMSLFQRILMLVFGKARAGR